MSSIKDFSMKFLVIGGGSMGKRRIRCLLANGVSADRIRLVDTRADRREESRSKHGVDGFADLAAGMNWGPSTVLVCLAGEKAGEVSGIALESGKNVFCEVPMGMTAAEARRLGALAEQKQVLAAPGAQQPFHPLVVQCRQWLRDPSFGKPLLFNLEWGQYMPGWHPYEDLSVFYSPGQLLGVMNLELVQLYFITDDRIDQLKCRREKVSSLATHGGDAYHMVGLTRNGMSVSLQFDLIQRPMRCLARFAGEQAAIELDFATDTVRRYLVATKQWESVNPPAGYVYEQCYIDEIAQLLRALNGQAPWHNPIAQAADAMAVLDAMQHSAAEPAVKVG